MASQKNLTAQVTYIEGASPNSKGNLNVTDIARTAAVVAGSWDVSLSEGYNPGSDLPRVQVLGGTPGFAQVDAIPGDAGKVRVRTWNVAGALTDLPWQFSNERNTPLTGTQDLLDADRRGPHAP